MKKIFTVLSLVLVLVSVSLTSCATKIYQDDDFKIFKENGKLYYYSEDKESETTVCNETGWSYYAEKYQTAGDWEYYFYKGNDEKVATVVSNNIPRFLDKKIAEKYLNKYGYVLIINEETEDISFLILKQKIKSNANGLEILGNVLGATGAGLAGEDYNPTVKKLEFSEKYKYIFLDRDTELICSSLLY